MTTRKASAEFVARAEKRWGPMRHWHCAYCGRGAGLTVDHFWPLADGGTDDITNTVPACDFCNRAKSDRAPIAWMVAVGVPERRIAMIVAAVLAAPNWTAPIPAGSRIPRMPAITRINPDYAAGRAIPRSTARPTPRPSGPNLDGLPPIFDLDDDAWSPRSSILRLAQTDPAASERWKTPNALYRELRDRGFREMKRTGTWGFWGIRTADSPAES